MPLLVHNVQKDSPEPHAHHAKLDILVRVAIPAQSDTTQTLELAALAPLSTTATPVAVE